MEPQVTHLRSTSADDAGRVDVQLPDEPLARADLSRASLQMESASRGAAKKAKTFSFPGSRKGFGSDQQVQKYEPLVTRI